MPRRSHDWASFAAAALRCRPPAARLGTLLGQVACCLLTSCSSVTDRTQVVLIVDADDSVRKEAARLDVLIEGVSASVPARAEAGATAAAPPSHFGASYTPDTASGRGWPYQFALTPLGGDATRLYNVELSAHTAQRKLARLRVRSGFVAGETLGLYVRFDATCVYEASLFCRDSETCHNGRCVSSNLDARSLSKLSTVDVERANAAIARSAAAAREAFASDGLD